MKDPSCYPAFSSANPAECSVEKSADLQGLAC
jgi:hypothetical protein